MNVELMRIAEKKLEQMGATVHGVLVKNEAGAWAAVSDAGRVMWLDNFEGQATVDQGEAGQDPIVWINPVNIKRTMIACPGETVEVSAFREGEFTTPLYTQTGVSGDEQYPDCDTCGKAMDYMPWHYSKGDDRHLHACDECWSKVNPSSGAVPEAIKAIADKLEQVEGKSAEGGYMWDARECAEFIREEADKLTAAPTAPVEGGGVPEPFVLGNSYRTRSGDLVRFVKVHNEGSSYETMEDEQGVNRYTNRRGDMGRVTARPADHLGNVLPLYTHPHNGEQGDTAPTDWMQVIEQNCWDLRCTSEPTGGDDYDVLWHVIEHHMAEPHERTLASDLCPIRALERALNPPTEREGE